MTPSEIQQAIELFDARVETKVERGMSRPEAVRAVVKEDPKAHRRYLAASNERAGNMAAARRLA